MEDKQEIQQTQFFKNDRKNVIRQIEEKKLVEKEEQIKEVEIYWKKRLDKIQNPFINETVKEVIQSFLYLKMDSVQRIHGFYQERWDDETFFELMYSMIYLNPKDSDELCDNKDFSVIQVKGPLLQSNHVINNMIDKQLQDPLFWYKGGAPYCYIFEGKISKIPQSQEEALVMIKQIQKIMKIAHLETLYDLDKDKYWKNQQIKSEFKDLLIQDMNQLELQRYRNQ